MWRTENSPFLDREFPHRKPWLHLYSQAKTVIGSESFQSLGKRRENVGNYLWKLQSSRICLRKPPKNSQDIPQDSPRSGFPMEKIKNNLQQIQVMRIHSECKSNCGDVNIVNQPMGKSHPKKHILSPSWFFKRTHMMIMVLNVWENEDHPFFWLPVPHFSNKPINFKCIASLDFFGWSPCFSFSFRSWHVWLMWLDWQKEIMLKSVETCETCWNIRWARLIMLIFSDYL